MPPMTTTVEDLVGVWDVPLSDRVHRVEFEHGTTTGRRVLRLDGRELLRRDWMFKLVGRELFRIGKAQCAIDISAVASFAYEYTLEVNGKTYKKFTEQMSKKLQTWITELAGNPTRICLEKETMDVWYNGHKAITTGEFGDDGTRTHFEMGTHVAYIVSESSGKKKIGIVHRLFVDGNEVPAVNVLA